MSFREKTAWVKLCALVIVSLLYWFHVPTLFPARPSVWGLHALGVSVAAYILIEVIAYYVLKFRNPEDANEPIDERERLIDLKALRVAYYVFVVSSIGGVFVALHVVGANTVAMGVMAVMAFVVAEFVKNIARIVFYRRGF